MELVKTIIQGKLLFSNEKSFAQALKMYEYRIEAYYKNDIIFPPEDIFKVEELTIEVPRMVRQLYEKTFKNTVGLLEYCSQFAISGFIDAWLLNEGKILIFKHLEPISDKVAVSQFIKGRDLMDQEGKEEEAIKALNRAIEKYNNHAVAYERRAKVNYMMRKYHDAKRDYSKSISIDVTNPYPYFGRAEVHMIEENWEDAILDLDKALKLSVALQAVYWKARRKKATCHMQLKQFDKAEFDLKLFAKREFAETDVNYEWLPWARYQYGVVLNEQEKYVEALAAFESVSEDDSEVKFIKRVDLLRNRAIAKKNAGNNGFITDLKEASKLGDKKATELLKNFT